MADSIPVNSRKSPRAAWIDYNYGAFFVTICTQNKRHYFGEISNEKMHLSEIGKYIERELQNPKLHHPHIEIPLFVVMPNHIHAIIYCNNNEDIDYNDIPKNLRNPNPSQRTFPNMSRHIPVLSKYIGSMKAAVSRFARTINPEFRWQTRYHDHAIRNTNEGNNIAEYIETNVTRWESDCFYD